MDKTLETPLAAAGTLAGRYLTFTLGHESYGIQVLKVREIIRMSAITAVPLMPDYVKGVINLRSKVIPIVDLRVKFELGAADVSERTCIVVVEVRMGSGANSLTGLIVDGVEEVANVAAGEIEDAPDFGSSLDTEYILGMAKTKDGVKMLLDIDKIVSAETIKRVKDAVTGGGAEHAR